MTDSKKPSKRQSNPSAESVQETLKEELKKSLDEAQWVWLARHADRDAVILVSPRLTLIEVAIKIAQDDTAAVSDWIQSGQIGKPTREQLDTWNAEPTRKFWTVVVQPYVLIQEWVN